MNRANRRKYPFGLTLPFPFPKDCGTNKAKLGRIPIKKPRKKPKPLNKTRLYDLATHYVARFATSSSKVEQYLARKLRERGWEDEAEPDIAGIVQRFVELGYIDDAHYAQVKADSLLRRGYGNRRITESLRHAGIDEQTTEAVKGDEGSVRVAVLHLARKKRLGPFGAQPLDQAVRQKQIHKIVRAGHDFQAAIAIIDAKSEADAEEWALEGE